MSVDVPTRLSGSYIFTLDDDTDVEVLFKAEFYPEHRESGCRGGNCPCCWGHEVEIDLETLTGADLTPAMVQEMEEAVQDAPDRWLDFPPTPERDHLDI